MSVFREKTFDYQGERMTFVPSLALLRRVQSRGINTTQLANQCIRGGVDLIDLSQAHVEFMRAAGVNLTEDESYGYMTTAGNQDEVMGFMLAYSEAAMPGVDMGKKPEAPATDAPKARAKSKPRSKTKTRT